MLARLAGTVLFLGLLIGGCGGDDRAAVDLIGAPVPEKDTTPDTGSAPDDPGRRWRVDLIQDHVFRFERDGWTLDSPEAHTSTARLNSAGLDLVLSAIPVSPQGDSAALERSLKTLERLVADTGGAVELASSMKRARELRGAGKLPLMILLEGADPLSGDLERLAELRKRGLAVLGIVASRDNAFAGSASQAGGGPGRGLSEAGRELVAACRDAGIVVDLTHAAPATFWDVLSGPHGPLLVSHSATRALRDHPRNLDDVQILGLARAGGVLGLVLNPDFLVPGNPPRAGVDDVVRHAMHVKSLGVVDALALGTDYGGIHPPRGLEDVSRLPALAEALRQQGLDDDEVAGVMGANAVRVLEEADRERGVETVVGEGLRPVPVDCESVTGEHDGAPELICDGYLIGPAATLPPASKQRLRLMDVKISPVRLELFGEPGTPWQVSGENLDGKVLLNRIVALDQEGRGELALPARRNLVRLFLSPTRPSALREAVVWGHRAEP